MRVQHGRDIFNSGAGDTVGKHAPLTLVYVCTGGTRLLISWRRKFTPLS